MFVVGLYVIVFYFMVILRWGYGLGVMAMARGGFHQSFFSVSWPTGEFGGMGLEGAVKAGFKKELAAIEDLQKREEFYESLVAQLYEIGKAINMAAHLEIDAVIDPADTRRWIMRGLKSASARQLADAGYLFVDFW